MSPFRDGWRHLRFLLVHSPTRLFMVPGLVLTVLGGLVSATVINILGRQWDIHTLVAGLLLLIVGTQVVGLGLCAHAYGTAIGTPGSIACARFRLEHGLLLGGVVLLTGLVIAAVIVITWINRGFGALSDERLAFLAAALIIMGRRCSSAPS